MEYAEIFNAASSLWRLRSSTMIPSAAFSDTPTRRPLEKCLEMSGCMIRIQKFRSGIQNIYIQNIQIPKGPDGKKLG